MLGARFAVFARRARVLPIPSQATRNLSFLEVSAAPSRCCFKSLSMWTGTGWIEFPTEWNLYKRARARSGAQCACLAHGLQCLRDGRACCPALPKQLVICRFLRCSAVPVTLLFQLVVSLDWYGMVCNFHSMKLVPTSTRTWWWCVCMSDARFAVFATGARGKFFNNAPRSTTY